MAGMIPMELLELILYFVIGFVSAFVGVNVGSGGLISIPALIFLGMPAKVAIATTRLGVLGLSSGMYRFHKEGMINYRIAVPAAILSLIGAYIGANTLLEFPEELISRLVGALILVALIFVILKRNIGVIKNRIKNKHLEILGYLLFIPMGFWGGFFGGGTGTFMAYVLILIFGQTFLESAGTRKLPVLSYTLISIIIFAMNGIVDWIPGIILTAGMLLGSYSGAAYGIKKGNAGCFS